VCALGTKYPLQRQCGVRAIAINVSLLTLWRTNCVKKTIQLSLRHKSWMNCGVLSACYLYRRHICFVAVVFVRLIYHILSPAEGSICCAYFSVFAIITMSIVASLLDQDTRYDGTPIYMKGVEDADDARRACINAGIHRTNCSQCFHIHAFCVLSLRTQ
jgi:hypothetical protein